jgi:hypothetical protein
VMIQLLEIDVSLPPMNLTAEIEEEGYPRCL